MANFILVWYARADFENLRLQTPASSSKNAVRDINQSPRIASPSHLETLHCNQSSILNTSVEHSAVTGNSVECPSSLDLRYISSGTQPNYVSGNVDELLASSISARPTPTRKCSLCDKLCLSNAALTRHMRTHTGERPFPCPLCPYAARQRYDLTRHITALHTNP